MEIDSFKPEAIEILNYLFPGLLCAWVYYGLSGFNRPAPLQQIIQALIYTGLIQGLVFCLKSLLFFVGSMQPALLFGDWSNEIGLLYASAFAILLGGLFAWTAANDALFKWLRGLRITQQLSYPTVWYGAFKEEAGDWVVLHLKDGRRLSGWPCDWATNHRNGFIRLKWPQWERSSEDQSSASSPTPVSASVPSTQTQAIPPPEVTSILLHVDVIKWVEFYHEGAIP